MMKIGKKISIIRKQKAGRLYLRTNWNIVKFANTRNVFSETHQYIVILQPVKMKTIAL